MITITEAAQLHIRKMKEENGETNEFLRFGVTGGGCSGLSYALGFEQEKKETDVQLAFGELSVLVDEKELKIVEGTVIDFKENLLGGGFTIDNPNAIASCGCGSSFRTKTEKGTPSDC